MSDGDHIWDDSGRCQMHGRFCSMALTNEGPLYWDKDDSTYWTCRECHTVQRVVEEHDEEIGYEEQARPVVVLNLGCGHEVVLRRSER